MRLAVVMLVAAGCGRVSFDSASLGDGTVVTYPEVVLASGPFAYYRLEEISEDPGAVDATANHNFSPMRTAREGTMTLVDGALGDGSHAVTFVGNGNPGDNSEGYVDFPEPDADTRWADLWNDDFTIELFFQLLERPVTATFALVLAEDYDEANVNGSGFRTGFTDDNKLRFWNNEANGQTTIPGPAVELRRWYHFAAIHRGNMVEMYLDGVRVVNEPTLDYLAPTGDTESGMGSFHGMPSNVTLDEVALYGKALDASQIAAHFAASGR